MTLQSLQEFLAGVDIDYAGLASKLHPEYQSVKELAAADHASLQTLGIRAGIVGVIIQAAKGASLPTPMQRLHDYQQDRIRHNTCTKSASMHISPRGLMFFP